MRSPADRFLAAIAIAAFLGLLAAAVVGIVTPGPAAPDTGPWPTPTPGPVPEGAR